MQQSTRGRFWLDLIDRTAAAARVCQRPSSGPRWWPSKSPRSSRDFIESLGGLLFVGGLVYAGAVAVGDDGVAVVQEPVEHADGGGVFG